MRKPASMVMTGIVTVGWVGLAACGSTSTSRQPPASAPITIGVSVSLTGDFSGDGKALVQGYDLWAQDENAKGGLLGHHVTMKYVDDASSTTQVVTNYQNLITQDKVALVFGPFSSLLTIPASTVTDRYRVRLPRAGRRWPERLQPHACDPLAVLRAARAGRGQPGELHAVGALAARRPSDRPLRRTPPRTTRSPSRRSTRPRSLLEAAGIKTSYYKVYPAETTDFTPLAQQVISANADIVILGTQEPDGIAFIKAFQQQHYNPKALIETAGPDQGSDFSKQVGVANTEGVMVPAGWWSSAKTPGQRHVRQRVRRQVRRHCLPTSHRDAAEAYSVGEVVDQAAQKAHSIANAALITALHTRHLSDGARPDGVRLARPAERRKLPRAVAERHHRARLSAVRSGRSARVPEARLLRVIRRRGPR